MKRETILSAVGKVAAKDLAEECSNGNGSGLVVFLTGHMDFESGDDIWTTMAASIQRQMEEMRRGRPGALSFNPAK